MADFKKVLFVLAPLAMIIAAIPASAQVTCTAFVANQPIMRQEGTTEPAGDIVISCQTGAAGLINQQALAQTLSIYVNGAAITSRQLYTTSSAPSSIPTDAALLVNDCTTNAGNSSGVPAFSCAASGNATSGFGPTQGFLQNGALVFSNFFLPPAANSTFYVRVTNIRVNANALAAGSFVTGTVLATFPVQNQSGLVLGAIQTSLSVTVTQAAPSPFAQCTSTPTAGTALSSGSLNIKELINTAFKAPNVNTSGLNLIPGQWYQNSVNTESMTVLPTANGATTFFSTGSGVTAATPGQADTATRIRVNFSNIPAGVSITLPVTITSGSSTLVATSSGDVGSFSLASGTTITLTTSGSITYEVRAQNGNGIDSFNVPVTVTYTYAPPSTPAVGSVLVSATYAATTAEVTSLTGQIPRFADTSVLAPLFTIAACQTDLLFSFLTNQAGFDTGYAIMNTSADPFGTAGQAGNCTLNWYGTGPAAGTSTTTPSVAAGSYHVNMVSTAAPGFQGYMIAQCNFQFGHGFAFISDGYGQPGKGLSQGMLALVIPTPGIQGGTRSANDASQAVKNSGEALNQ